MAASTFTANELVVMSDLISRAFLAQRMGQAFDGQRDYYQTFGYQQTLTFDDYYAWYKRGGLAKRIIDLPCKATWRQPPEVLEDENPKSDTQFEAEWNSLNRRLNLVSRLFRADVLQSIGSYAVLLLGTRDGAPLSEPLIDGQFTSADDLLYTQPLSEAHAQITAVETNTKDPRYGMPTIYNVSLGQGTSGATTAVTRVVPVHYSRIIHFAEGALEDDVIGTPKLESVVNLLFDLLKVSGGGAETYWLNAANKIKIETEPGYAINEQDMPGFKDKLAEFVRGLNPWLILQGTKGERMGVQVADPTGNYEVLVSQIAGTQGIPRRILTGSERGELASTQDRENFAELIVDRRATHAEPGMLRPFVDRLIALGILPAPTSSEYQVKWEHPIEMKDSEKADLALKRAQAASAYITGSAEIVFTPEEFRESMGLDPEKPDSDPLEQPVNEQDPQVQAQFDRRAA